nr:TauD/TfdA family dioxygenase [Frankia sp. AgB32]
MHEVHGGSNGGWHFDASSLPTPPLASMLRGVRVPPTGGDTLWASGVEAYRALSPELREADRNGSSR